MFRLSKYRTYDTSRYRTCFAHPLASPCFFCILNKSFDVHIKYRNRVHIKYQIYRHKSRILVSSVHRYCIEHDSDIDIQHQHRVLLLLLLLRLLLLLPLGVLAEYSAAVRHRTPATRGCSSHKQYSTRHNMSYLLPIFFHYIRKYFSTPLGSTSAFVRPRRTFTIPPSWPLRAFAEPQAGVSPLRRSPTCTYRLI